MYSNTGQQTLFPGAVTSKYGNYLVTHSTAHHPVTKSFIDRDIILPPCSVAGCKVTFQLIRLISWTEAVDTIRTESRYA